MQFVCVQKRCCAFYHPGNVRTCLVMTTGCEKLLQKVVSSFTFCRTICSLRLLPAQGKLWRNTRIQHDSCVILSNRMSVFTQWTQLKWRWVVKWGTLLNFYFLHLGKIFILTVSSALGVCNGIRMKTWAGEFLAGKIYSIFFFTNQEAGRVGKYPWRLT